MNYYKFIEAYDNCNNPLLEQGNDVLPKSYLNILKLDRGQQYTYRLPGFESVSVVLTGQADITVDDMEFPNVGQRKDIWSGQADSVYAGIDSTVAITAKMDGTEIAVAGGAYDQPLQSFRITPDEVYLVDVGSNETKSRRRIYHITGHNTQGRTGNLLVSELYCDEGCWSGYPPHKHDTENPPNETEFEEIYHYRFNPETGFGGQFCFLDDRDRTAFMTRHGDTFCFRRGYHPTVVSPGHAEYIFTVLVGVHQRSLVQNFEEKHRYLMNKIPGINNMTAKFKG